MPPISIRNAVVAVAALAACALTLALPSPRHVTPAAPERCVACHGPVAGLGEYHAPQRIGCASCHGGDPKQDDKALAHAGLIRIPGNLDDAPRTCGTCHAAIVARVERSIMTTMAGVIAVDRRVLGEAVDASGALPHASGLGHSVADSHLRELCVSCHLGQPKTETGAIGQQSRGGGCNACHLVYDANAVGAHPSLEVNPTNGHCFGCHSRSGRIATSYEGWHEIHDAQAAGVDPSRLRKLDDGRLFEYVAPDVHHARGLDCIDCHTSKELMGIDATVARKTDQLRIACTDCHAAKLASVGTGDLDAEARMLLALRRWGVDAAQRFGATRHGDALVNVLVDADGRGQLRRKRTGELLPLRPPLAVCTQGGGHARLSCASCHSAWAPRCPTCHTAFDAKDEGFDNVAQRWVQGTWNETSGPFEAMPPTLGVRTRRDAAGKQSEVVDTFVPGMIMTFDRNRDSSGAPDMIFRRLYAPMMAHTITTKSRTCRSCHLDPVALGFGKGALRLETAKGGVRWRFEPRERALPQDGLPADAWTGFLRERSGMVSTQPESRPFDAAEQRRILRVGACLTCHAGDSPLMRSAVADFQRVLARRTPRCLVP